MGKRTIIYGKGVHGEGRFHSRINSKKTKVYQAWVNILERCYSEKFHKKSPSYIGCTMVDEWHNFQNFGEWFDRNYIDGFAIDKDILFPGNKIYGPEFCSYVPVQINTMLTHASRRKTQYDHLPPGVTFCTFTNRYMAFMSTGGKFKMLGRFDSISHARARYLSCKKAEVIRMANEWRDQIGEKVYQALLVFPVDMEK